LCKENAVRHKDFVKIEKTGKSMQNICALSILVSLIFLLAKPFFLKLTWLNFHAVRVIRDKKNRSVEGMIIPK